MKKKRWKIFRTCAAGAALLIFMATVSVQSFAADVQNRTVRVGVFPLGNFHSMEQNGTAVGYDVEFIERTAEFSHWNVEFVEAENWKSALDMLDAGGIDLLAPAQKNAEREEKYLFSAFSMSTELGAVQVLADRDELLYEDFETMAGLRYGAMENSPITTHFIEAYCPSAGFVPDITYYADATELYQALYDGAVDAVATNIMLGDDGVKMIGRYSPSPVYYIARKDDAKLMQELDDAMTELVLDSPGWQNELFAKYFDDFSSVNLTHEEQQFVDTLPVITVGCEVNHAPLSYQDAQTGEIRGITREILDSISTATGISFRYEALPATDVTWEYLQEHEIYVLANVEYNDVNQTMQYMHMTSPYLESEKVLVARGALDFTSESRLNVALATGSQTLSQSIIQVYPNFTTQTYATVEECLTAVLEGRADATIQNRYVADCSLSNPDYESLTVVPAGALTDKLCIATIEMPDKADPIGEKLNSNLFRSVIDKGIKKLTGAQVNDSIIRCTSEARHHTTLFDLVRKNWVAVGALVLLLLAAAAMLVWKQRTEAVRARELAAKNRALGDAIEQAERANRAKSQFLARMSHEIRTPMNAIVGITEIAQKHEKDPGKVHEYLLKIKVSSKVLLSIINDVLDMSAIESDKMKIASAEFDIKQVINGIVNVYYPQCTGKGVRLVVGTDIQEEMLIGDSLRVEQILMNLISNAYKFTESGGTIQLEVRETSRKGNQVYLQFRVSDTGCGMSEEMLGRLFKPFEQETAQTAQAHGGSGLGMSIAKSLVSMMHGAIRADSEKGKGTTFTVDLPFTTAEITPPVTKENLRDIRALVVDDDASAAEYTSLILERIGVQYQSAGSGAQALEMAKKSYSKGCGFDICFIDWRMPHMSGIELTRRLRAEFDRDTMIIIVSAYDTSEVMDEAKDAGADMFVSKPLFQSTVFNLLMNLSGGRYVNETAEPEGYDFTGHRVLLAEDNALNREIAVDLLDMVHLAVDTAENGRKALEAFSDAAPGTYEAILMDIQMPVMDGYEAARQIRAMSRPDAAVVPIFAMTANAFSDDVSAALNAGMNGHIAKPIDTDTLYKTLAEVLLKKNADS